jgi:membrane protein
MATTLTEPGAETHADSPTDLDSDDWRSVAKRVVANIKRDHVPLNAAGVAFFAFLATIPAMVALVAVYGLVADPSAIEERVDDIAGTLPAEARELLVQQLEAITSTAGGALTLSLLIGVGVALWSASSGMGYLIEAVNIAYDRTEKRGFVSRRLLSLGFTLGGIVFAAVAIGVITALPAVLAAAGITGGLRWLLTLAAWPLVGVGLMLALAVLYRYAPNREPDPKWRWVSPGAVVAVVAWLAVSIGFQIYVANFGSYNETYGSLGAVVVLMLWIWISALVILVGAELNCELERQTSADTTE